MFLARKISQAKWDLTRGPNTVLDKHEISADAVTVDLRTKANKLSFWRCSNLADNEFEDVALAITSAGEEINKIDIVWLKTEDLLSDGHVLQNSNGRTPVGDLVQKHVDICRLDKVRHGLIAERVAEAIKIEQYYNISRQRMKLVVLNAIEENRVAIDDFDPKIQKEIFRWAEMQ